MEAGKMKRVDTSYCAWLVTFEDHHPMTDANRIVKTAVCEIYRELDAAASLCESERFDRIEDLARLCGKTLWDADAVKEEEK
jgi:hypothetical protein